MQERSRWRGSPGAAMLPSDHPHVVVAGLGHFRVELARQAVSAGHRTTVHDPSPDRLDRLLTALSSHDTAAATLRTAIGDGRCVLSADPTACAAFDTALVCPAPADGEDVEDPVEQSAALLAPHVRRDALVVLALQHSAEAAAEMFAVTVELLTGLRAGADYRLGLLFTGPVGPPTVVTAADPVAARRTAAFLRGLGRWATEVLPIEAAECFAALQRAIAQRGET